MIMSAPNDDNTDPELKYAPKWSRQQPAMPDTERPPYVSVSPLPKEEYQGQRIRALWPHPVPDPPPSDWVLALLGRIAKVAGFAALVALLAIFGKPLLQRLALLEPDSQTTQVSKPSDRVTANDAPANRALVPATVIAAASSAAPSASAQAQQAPLPPAQGQQASLSPSSNPVGQESNANSAVRGVTASEIRFGISAPFTGAAKELGQNMKLGIEAAFGAANAKGGVYGRQLRLIAADDGYEPPRTAVTMPQLYERDQVFGLIGDVGTPTAVVALPYALDRKMLFFGAFTGAGLLRNDPPDRYVFNYRASYAEETAAVVNYLVKVRRLLPDQIAVFAQQDAYGDAGFAGVQKAIRSLRGGNASPILRLNYQRNTIDVDDAVAQLQQKRPIPIKAVIMVPTYRAAAKFIEKTRNLYPDMIYTSVSFVGSTALADELMLLGKKFATGVIVTQVVPAVDGHSSLVLDYKSALAKYSPGQASDYVSLEGYVDANVLIAALQRNGSQLDTEKLVGTLENLHDLDIGLGTPVTFSRSDHQGVHKVWGTQLDETGHYQPIDLQ
ncbi:MAG: ABC transporter substrate-binding protein [Xanthobacteraceae bacterium]|jgi:branched-chain amino acid transport system substrate-binding protein